MTKSTGRGRRGRPPGSPNKATIEKQRIAAEIASRTVADAKAQNRKLAKEHLQEFLPVLAGMAAYHQPTFPGMPQQNPNGSVSEFMRYFDLFLSTARTLAPYESATFRAVDLRAILPSSQDANPVDVLRAMLEEIDDESRQERAETRQIEHVR